MFSTNERSGNVWIEFDKQFLDRNLSKAAQNFDARQEEDDYKEKMGTGYGFYVNLNRSIFDVTDSMINEVWTTEGDEISIAITNKLSVEDHERMTTYLIKTLNKMKSIFESAKGLLT